LRIFFSSVASRLTGKEQHLETEHLLPKFCFDIFLMSDATVYRQCILFVFRCNGNGGRSWENAIGSIRWPIPP